MSPRTRHRGETRRRYRDLVLGTPPRVPSSPSRRPPRVVAGTVLDSRPDVLVLDVGGAAERVPLTATTTIWHGGRGDPAALRPGRVAIVRVEAGAADRIWVDIGRVTGTILACGRNTVEVDMGPHRGPTCVVIPPHALGRILVRHPRLEPGYLIDVICVRSPDGPQATRPGTSQPGYLPADLAAPTPDASVPEPLEGTVTWFGGATYTGPPNTPPSAQSNGGSPHSQGRAWTAPSTPSPPQPEHSRADLSRAESAQSSGGRNGGLHRKRRQRPRHASPKGRSRGGRPRSESGRPSVGAAYRLTSGPGAAYPFVDPEGKAGGCAGTPPGCVALPYLSVGSELTIHNQCADVSAALPVIECGCVAARYCDRCVECGTSPRGRLAELTPAAFVALGGDLDVGCFNAVLWHGAPGLLEG